MGAVATVGAVAALALLVLLLCVRVWELWHGAEAWRAPADMLDCLRRGGPSWRR